MFQINRKKLKHICLGFCAVILFAVILQSSGVVVDSNEVEAASTGTEAQLRLIFTTDIHGQLTSTDYETGTTLSGGGLARAYNVIKQARNEVDNYMTFDVGDVMYDYTTEYIYSQNQSVLQPIYQAMELIGYDAITLGNHEFDYDWDYIVNQLKLGGLTDKVVTSNLTYSKSGDPVFNENMIITKELTTTDGKTVSVNVGIIGETFPYLSTKSQDFTGTLSVEALVTNVTKEAALLKEEGADIIVVLAHSGMGPEDATEDDHNASYALTKIDDVDVVLCGHEHNAFPSEDQTGTYYKLSGVDKTTNLVNGKILIMAQDRCKSIGIADLTLSIKDGVVEITDQTPEVRAVTSSNSVEEKAISSLFDEWSDQLLEYSQTTIGSVTSGSVIENYNGLVEDNSAIQLLNDAKRAYALNYIHNNKEEYVGYPVIAASSYVSYGGESYLDYVNISGDMTESDLASLQAYNGYTAIYTITGAQLKEWIEWSASAYETVNSTASWSDSVMSSYMSSSGLNSLISEDWLDDWSAFYVFDGVEYTINPAAAPRYDINGNKINTTNRVTSLTYNGEAVTDDQVFVLAASKLSKTCEANAAIKNQAIYKGYVRTQGVIRDYIEQLCKLGTLSVEPDYNWNVTFSNTSYQFIVKTTSLGSSLLESRSWYKSTLGTTSDYTYSIGTYFNSSTSDEPKVIVTSTNTDVTNSKVKVAVEATSVNGIEQIRYLYGEYDKTSTKWTDATIVTSNSFYAPKNGIYTVYVRDTQGNVVTQQVCIDNIYENALATPTVSTYTNRKTKISGKADPNTEIVIETSSTTYTTTTDTKGAFSLKIPAQNSGTQITVYAVDEVNNYRSSETTVKVKRTGPNKPYFYGATNTSDSICGNLNDDDADIIAIVGKTVYCGNEEAAERYKNCSDLYNKNYTIVITSITVGTDLEYELTVPAQAIGTKIVVYNIDHLNRKSMKTTQTVTDDGPNPPDVYEVTSIDNKVYGNVTSSTAKTIFNVYVTVGGYEYQGTTDTSGDFSITIDPNALVVGETVSVYATDTAGGDVRSSRTTSVTIEDPQDLIDEKTNLAFYEMQAGDTSISGQYDDDEAVFIAVISGSKKTVYETESDSTGQFKVTLSTALLSTDVVYAYSRYTYSGIVEMICEAPAEVVPSTPVIETSIGNNTKSVTVSTDTVAKVTMTVGSKTYKTSKYSYDSSTGKYSYTLSITKPDAGSTVKVTATNSAGTSKTRKTTVAVVVPSTPTVDTITADATKVTGTITTTGSTMVYVKIGSKTYEAIAKSSGKFSVTIPETKKGTKVVIYAKNSSGTGTKTTTKVTKKSS